MDEAQKRQIQKFVNDKGMSRAVYLLLLDTFLRERPQADVYVLAASRLAIDYLKQGWKELEKYKFEEPSQGNTS